MGIEEDVGVSGGLVTTCTLVGVALEDGAVMLP